MCSYKDVLCDLTLAGDGQQGLLVYLEIWNAVLEHRAGPHHAVVHSYISVISLQSESELSAVSIVYA